VVRFFLKENFKQIFFVGAFGGQLNKIHQKIDFCDFVFTRIWRIFAEEDFVYHPFWKFQALPDILRENFSKSDHIWPFSWFFQNFVLHFKIFDFHCFCCCCLCQQARFFSTKHQVLKNSSPGRISIIDLSSSGNYKSCSGIWQSSFGKLMKSSSHLEKSSSHPTESSSHIAEIYQWSNRNLVESRGHLAEFSSHLHEIYYDIVEFLNNQAKPSSHLV
jgi:hypothetical protein